MERYHLSILGNHASCCSTQLQHPTWQEAVCLGVVLSSNQPHELAHVVTVCSRGAGR